MKHIKCSKYVAFSHFHGFNVNNLGLIAFVGYIGTFFLMFATLINDTFSDSANLGIVLDEYVLAFEIVMILMLFIYSVVNFMDGFRKTGVAFYSEMIEILQKFMHNQVK